MIPPRLRPLQVGTLTLSNRIVVPPMASGTADARGHATFETVAHYARLAASGAGLVFVEYAFVHASGRSEPLQLGASQDAHVEGLAQVARAVKAQGAKVGLQLVHAGGKTTPNLTGGILHSPSGIAVPVKEREMPVPAEMGEAERALWRDAFAAAARRAALAGFDVVELHAAHGYGLNQWLSPLTNARSDAYGGSVERRFRLLGECIDAVRSGAPDLALAVRMPGIDFLPGGQSLDEGVRLARLLVARGVDVIDVSSGLGGWRRPTDRRGEGYLLPEARVIQDAVNVPVIAVGGFATPGGMDAALSGPSHVALVAAGRTTLEGARWV